MARRTPAASARAAARRMASGSSSPTRRALGATNAPRLAMTRIALFFLDATYARILSDASFAAALSLIRAWTRRRSRSSSRLARAERICACSPPGLPDVEHVEASETSVESVVSRDVVDASGEEKRPFPASVSSSRPRAMKGRPASKPVAPTTSSGASSASQRGGDPAAAKPHPARARNIWCDVRGNGTRPHPRRASPVDRWFGVRVPRAQQAAARPSVPPAVGSRRRTRTARAPMPRAGASARIVPATTAPAFSFERGDFCRRNDRFGKPWSAGGCLID